MVKSSPSPDETKRDLRVEVSRKDRPVQTDRRAAPLILGVKVRDPVLLMKHPDHDSVERGDDGHDVAVRTPDLPRYGCLDKTCAAA